MQISGHERATQLAHDDRQRERRLLLEGPCRRDAKAAYAHVSLMGKMLPCCAFHTRLDRHARSHQTKPFPGSFIFVRSIPEQDVDSRLRGVLSLGNRGVSGDQVCPQLVQSATAMSSS